MQQSELSKKASNKRHKKILNLWKSKFGLESFETDDPSMEEWERPFQFYEDNGYYSWIVAGVDPITGDIFSLQTTPDVNGRISHMVIFNEGLNLGGEENCNDQWEYEMVFPRVGMAKDLVTSLTKNKSLKILRKGFLGKKGFSEKSVYKFLDKLEPVVKEVSGLPHLFVDTDYERCSSDGGEFKWFTLGEELKNVYCLNGEASC